MKLYFAGKWEVSTFAALNRAKRELGPLISVTSRWLELDPLTRTTSPADAARIARMDLEDIDRADGLVLFNFYDQKQSPGRNIEFGYALAKGKALFIVGERCGVFQQLEQICHFTTLEQFHNYFLERELSQ